MSERTWIYAVGVLGKMADENSGVIPLFARKYFGQLSTAERMFIALTSFLVSRMFLVTNSEAEDTIAFAQTDPNGCIAFQESLGSARGRDTLVVALIRAPADILRRRAGVVVDVEQKSAPEINIGMGEGTGRLFTTLRERK